MRLLGAVVVAAIMYVAVPLLWQHMMIGKVNEMQAHGVGIPVGNAVEVNWAASQNLVAGVNGSLINEEEMNKFEQVGAQAAANDAMRQAQQAQDRAWQASHPNIP
jgi:hypothetical protein